MAEGESSLINRHWRVTLENIKLLLSKIIANKKYKQVLKNSRENYYFQPNKYIIKHPSFT